MTQTTIVGTSMPRVEAKEKVVGRAVFAADVYLPNMLHAKMLGSPHAHAKIVQINTRKAEALPGVVAVVTARDVLKSAAYNPASRAHNFLARDKVFFVGQPVAAVAALDPHVAEEALSLIQVQYQILPAVLDPIEAMQPDAPLIEHGGKAETELGLHTADALAGKSEGEKKPSNVANHIVFKLGDVAQGFAAADATAEATFHMPMVHQGYIEPHAAVADWEAASQQLTVWVTTQSQFDERAILAEVLGLPLQRIKVVSTEIGGGFGAKFGLIGPLTALLAMKAGRPVKLVYTRHEELQAANPAPQTIIEVKVGAKKDGALTALKAKVITDTGAYPGSPMTIICMLLGAPYRIPHLEIEGFEVLTNKASVAAYRAPGAPNAGVGIECTLDMLAEKLGLDPLQMRLKNAAEEGVIRPDGTPHPKIGLKETLQAIAQHPIWKTKLGPNQGRGFAIGGWGGGRGPASATVKLEDNGAFHVVVGSVDLTGTHTAFAQIAAEVLNMPLSKVQVIKADTDTASFAPASGGSQITYSMGVAVKEAAAEARRQILERAAQELEAESEMLEMADGKVWVRVEPSKEITLAKLYELSAGWTAKYTPIVGHASIERRKGAPSYAAAVADVEVEPETGRVQLLRLVVAQDVGKAINPMAVEGQMQGAAVQGVGMALWEELAFGPDGHVLNASLLDYHKPTAGDVPFIETMIVEVPSDDGPFGAKIVGEPSIIPPAPAIANAVADAIGVRITEFPITPERVWRAMQAGTRRRGRRGGDRKGVGD